MIQKTTVSNPYFGSRNRYKLLPILLSFSAYTILCTLRSRRPVRTPLLSSPLWRCIAEKSNMIQASSNLWLPAQSCIFYPDSQPQHGLRSGSASADPINSPLTVTAYSRDFTSQAGCSDHSHPFIYLVNEIFKMQKHWRRDYRGLPGFFRCMRQECSRFPRCCCGTPATSVCCSSPGLGSFLRPRSAASWAPRIGRRRETGTYFSNTLDRRS